jgi:hypothetical protein
VDPHDDEGAYRQGELRTRAAWLMKKGDGGDARRE